MLRTLVLILLLFYSRSLVAQLDESAYLYFDYIAEYQYENVYEEDGRILIRFNSEDKIAMFQFYQEGAWLNNIFLIAFEEGENIFVRFKDEVFDGKFNFKVGERLNAFPFSDSLVLEKYLKFIPGSHIVADYETSLYEGIGPDGTYRKIYLLENTFDARVAFQMFEAVDFLIPYTMVEAQYLTQDQILMKSEIYQDDQLLHRLEMIYLEHDFYRLQLDEGNYLNEFRRSGNAHAMGKSSKLYQKFQPIWDNYDRMAGLNYAPRDYEFDRCFEYKLLINGEEDSLYEVCFSSLHSVCAVSINGIEQRILAFQNRQFHLYYQNDSLESECIVYREFSNLPSLDDLDFISASGEYFRGNHTPTSAKQSPFSSDDWYIKNQLYDDDPNEILAFRRVDFDPRGMHAGVHEVMPEYPEFLTMITPPYQLMTYWSSTVENGDKIEFILNRHIDEIKTWSDKSTVRFIKLN